MADHDCPRTAIANVQLEIFIARALFKQFHKHFDQCECIHSHYALWLHIYRNDIGKIYLSGNYGLTVIDKTKALNENNI
jgi:hypothetical protein